MDFGKLRTRFNDLFDGANSWRAHWREVRTYILPTAGAFLESKSVETQPGKKVRSYIYNNVAEQALRIQTSGLHGGLTSPSRPWFRLTLDDPELAEWIPARRWLDDVRDRLLRIFQNSNFYSSIHELYEEVGAFGTGSMFIADSPKTVIRCRTMTIGEYYLALDQEMRVDTMYRLLAMTARQMAETFGEEKLSARVKSALEGKPSQQFMVLHVIAPDKERISGKPYLSVYLEWDSSATEPLDMGGYDNLPFVAGRWRVTGSNIYGRSPGMVALPDVKQLQRMEKDKLKGLAKMVDPPLKAGGKLKPVGGNIVPGGVTYVESSEPESFKPIYEVNLNLAAATEEILRVEDRIRRTFYNDLFLSILQEEKTMTAREVVERHNEKLLLLGPVLERLQSELLDAIIDRTFNIAMSHGLIPEPPMELQGRDYKIEYISLLAQAQKLAGLTAMEQLTTFTLNLAQIEPAVVDQVDLDKLVQEYAETLGVAADVLRDEDEVAEVRQQRAQAQQAAQAAQTGLAAAKGAKDLAQAKMTGNDALSRLLPALAPYINQAQEARGQEAGALEAPGGGA